MNGAPYAIVDRNGVIAAIVPERVVGEVMTSALIPNMGYRMECRPATTSEIFDLAIQLEMVKKNVVENPRYQAVEGAGQQLVVIPIFRDPNQYEPKEPTL